MLFQGGESTAFWNLKTRDPGNKYLPGDSSRELFIPIYPRLLEVTFTTFPKGVTWTHHPKKGTSRIARYIIIQAPRGAKLMGRGVPLSNPLRVWTQPVGGCWYVYILYTHVADWQWFKRKSTRNTMVVVPDWNEHNPRGLRVATPLTIGVDKQQQSLIHRKNRSVHYNQPTIWVFPKIGLPQSGWFIMGKPY